METNLNSGHISTLVILENYLMPMLMFNS